jgi:Domain of unknown function (DUF4142)
VAFIGKSVVAGAPQHVRVRHDWARRRNHVRNDRLRSRTASPGDAAARPRTDDRPAWLEQHQEITVVARDRGGGYGEAAARALFERYGKGGDNAQLQNGAKQTLPTLQHHLDMAQAPDTQVRK